MAFHLAPRPLTRGDLERHYDVSKCPKILILSQEVKISNFDKLWYFLQNSRIWGQSVHFRSCDTAKR